VWKTAIGTSKGESWGKILDKCSRIIAYADDVLIMEEDYKMFKK